MTRSLLLILASFTFFANRARADVAPPEVVSCYQLQVGSSCENDTGTCQDSTCTGGGFVRGAGTVPPVTTYACRKCVPRGAGTETRTGTVTGATDANTGTGTGATTAFSTSTDTGAATKGNVSTDTNVTTTASTGTGASATTATTTGKENDTKDSSGCSISGMRGMAPWLLAGAFGAFVMLLRRRPRG
jgi:hypothetical protein